MTTDAFMLGSHIPSWLSKVDIPLFISHRRLRRYKTLPKATTRWSLDSGGFSELSLYGKWTLAPIDYVQAVRRYRDEIGLLDWAAPQDWMCEPVMIATTGLSIREHQYRTVENFLLLRQMAPDLPFVPVLQGWHLNDYLACVDMYRQAGIDLCKERIVGLGSVCRRQATDDIGRIAENMHDRRLRLHGFGVKSAGLAKYSQYLASADSMAWSFRGRHVKPCTHGTAMSEANCVEFALEWRQRTLDAIPKKPLVPHVEGNSPAEGRARHDLRS